MVDPYAAQRGFFPTPVAATGPVVQGHYNYRGAPVGYPVGSYVQGTQPMFNPATGQVMAAPLATQPVAVVPESHNEGGGNDAMNALREQQAKSAANNGLGMPNTGGYISFADMFDGGGAGYYGGAHEGGGILSTGANAVSGVIGQDNLLNTGAVKQQHNVGSREAAENSSSSKSSGGK